MSKTGLQEQAIDAVGLGTKTNQVVSNVLALPDTAIKGTVQTVVPENVQQSINSGAGTVRNSQVVQGLDQMATDGRQARDQLYNEMSREEERRRWRNLMFSTDECCGVLMWSVVLIGNCRQEGGWGNWFKNGLSIAGKNTLYGFSTLGGGLMNAPGAMADQVQYYTTRDFFLELMANIHHAIKSIFT